MAREIRLETLAGRRVVDSDGRLVGHIEEVVARREGRALVVVEFRLGAYALMHRLADAPMGRALLRALPFSRPLLYRVPWRALDLSDPARPTLRGRREELTHGHHVASPP
jgi:PRC-barrel domain